MQFLNNIPVIIPLTISSYVPFDNVHVIADIVPGARDNKIK
jgi:hypothetical protein